LRTVGLEALVQGSESGYIEAAVGLADNPALLASLRAGLRQRMLSSPLMDASTFTRELEGKLVQSWEARHGLGVSA
jgi:predicted O-linked N-acetylglucosamine transferase (SPINDLY family)